jgi:hypothetical protein
LRHARECKQHSRHSRQTHSAKLVHLPLRIAHFKAFNEQIEQLRRPEPGRPRSSGRGTVIRCDGPRGPAPSIHSASAAPLAALRRYVLNQLATSAIGWGDLPRISGFSPLRSATQTAELSTMQVDGGVPRHEVQRNRRKSRSAAARPLRGRLPSAPALTSALSTSPT